MTGTWLLVLWTGVALLHLATASVFIRKEFLPCDENKWINYTQGGGEPQSCKDKLFISLKLVQDEKVT